MNKQKKQKIPENKQTSLDRPRKKLKRQIYNNTQGILINKNNEEVLIVVVN